MGNLKVGRLVYQPAKMVYFSRICRLCFVHSSSLQAGWINRHRDEIQWG